MKTDVRPYRVAIPQRDLDDLAERLRRTIWPDELADASSDYGMPNARVARLAAYWRDSFDWRALEDRLNSYPQFVAEIERGDHPLPACPVGPRGRHAAHPLPRLARFGARVPGRDRPADRARQPG